MTNKQQLNEIKKNLNRGTSAIFVLGQGIEPNDDLFYKNKQVKDLYSSDKQTVKSAWNDLLDKYPEPTKLPFIEGFTNYVEKTAPVKLAKYTVLNTSITLGKGNFSSNTNVINLNGSLYLAIDPKSGLLNEVGSSDETNAALPIFIPTEKNYDVLFDAVGKLEERVSEQDVRIIFFIGTSGKCPVVESLLNRSITRALIKDPVYCVVVNPSETYMDDVADLVIRSDAKEFLLWMEEAYSEAGEYF